MEILNGHEKIKEGTSRGDTTTNLHNFSSRNFSVPDRTRRQFEFWATGPKTRQIPSQEAMTTFLEMSKIMNIDRNWPHIRLFGLRIKRFESQRCYQSTGTPPDPPNCHIKFKIDQQNPRPDRPDCPLNLAINRTKTRWRPIHAPLKVCTTLCHHFATKK